jgi:hypothetical protein
MIGRIATGEIEDITTDDGDADHAMLNKISRRTRLGLAAIARPSASARSKIRSWAIPIRRL